MVDARIFCVPLHVMYLLPWISCLQYLRHQNPESRIQKEFIRKENPNVLVTGNPTKAISRFFSCRSQWLHGLRRRSSAARLLRSWVRVPTGAWMFVCCECCVLSGRGLCDGLITRPEESYRLWRVVVCDQETSKTRSLKPATGLWEIQPQRVVTPGKQTNKRFFLHTKVIFIPYVCLSTQTRILVHVFSTIF